MKLATEHPKTAEFMRELEALCRKHGVSISHEDLQGGFEIHVPLSEEDIAWVNEADAIVR
jgi:hypothetical protein